MSIHLKCQALPRAANTWTQTGIEPPFQNLFPVLKELSLLMNMFHSAEVFRKDCANSEEESILCVSLKLYVLYRELCALPLLFSCLSLIAWDALPPPKLPNTPRKL